MKRKRGWFDRHWAWITKRFGAAPAPRGVLHDPRDLNLTDEEWEMFEEWEMLAYLAARPEPASG